MSKTNRELAEGLAAIHEEFYRRNPRGQLEQSVFVEHGDGETAILQCGWANPMEREVTIAMLRVYMELNHATRYAFWSEAWQVVAPDLKLDDYQPGSLAQDPRREEVVFTFVITRDGQREGICQKLVRGKNGGVRKLERSAVDDTFITGALAELFPQKEFDA